MNTKAMIGNLRELYKRHKNDHVDTCATNWSLVCWDVANRLEELEKKIAELQNQIPKWHYVADNDFPINDDNRFYLCISENHEQDLPSMFQYEPDYGFGWWEDYYDAQSLGFKFSDFRTSEDEYLEKVIAWCEIPKFEGGGINAI